MDVLIRNDTTSRRLLLLMGSYNRGENPTPYSPSQRNNQKAAAVKVDENTDLRG